MNSKGPARCGAAICALNNDIRRAIVRQSGGRVTACIYDIFDGGRVRNVEHVHWTAETRPTRPIDSLAIVGGFTEWKILEQMCGEATRIDVNSADSDFLNVLGSILKPWWLELTNCDVSEVLPWRTVAHLTISNCVGTSVCKGFTPRKLRVTVPFPEPLSRVLIANCEELTLEGPVSVAYADQLQGYLDRTALTSLMDNSKPRDLRLSNISIGEDSVRQIMTWDLDRISFAECRFETDSSEEWLETNNHVKHLELESMINDSLFVSILNSLPKLVSLAIDYCNISPGVATAMRSLQELRHLQIGVFADIEYDVREPFTQQMTVLRHFGSGSEDLDRLRELFPNAEGFT